METAQIIEFKKSLDQAAQAAVSQAMSNAAELANVIIESVNERIEQIKTAPVMRVQIGEAAPVVLNKPASKVLPELVGLLSIGEAVYLNGPAGCGKTTACEQAADVLGMEFYHFVFAPDMGTSACFGRQTVEGFTESIIVKAAKNGGLLFLDELDNASPEILVALNGLGDKSGRLYNSVTGETIKIHDNFRLVAAGNTNGLGATSAYTARQRQDLAALTRFAMIKMDYCEDLERSIWAGFGQTEESLQKLQNARKELRSKKATQEISTRHIERVGKVMQSLGWSFEKACEVSFTSSWPAELSKQVYLA